MSIGIHMSGNLSAGLFSAAVMESNLAGFRYRSREEQGLYGHYFLQNLPNCSQAEGTALDTCLQQFRVEEIHSAAGKAENQVWAIVRGNAAHWLDAVLAWVPCVDGVEVPELPMQAFAAGHQQKVPLLVGTNSNEGTTFIYAGLPSISGAEFKAALPLIFGAKNAAKIMHREEYRSQDFHSAKDQIARMLTDYWFRCSSHRMARAQSDARLESYVYRFNHAPSFKQLWPMFGLPTQCEDRVCHMSEVPFVFNNYANFTDGVTSAEFALAKVIGEYWTSFAQQHTPISPASGIEWPRFDPTQLGLVLDVGTPQQPNVTTESSAEICNFWDTIGYLH